jgi:hypothetical protein
MYPLQKKDAELPKVDRGRSRACRDNNEGKGPRHQRQYYGPVPGGCGPRSLRPIPTSRKGELSSLGSLYVVLPKWCSLKIVYTKK